MVPKLTRKSKVKFYHLFNRKEEGEYIIGREDTEEFIGVPAEGEAALRLLKEGKTIAQAEELLRKEYGEVDVLDFANQLRSEGFIKSIDGQHFADKHGKVRHVLNWVKPKHVSWLFSGPAYVFFFAIILAGLVIMNVFTQYLPSFQDFFFHDSLTVIYIISFIIGWLLVFGHELWHFMGARSLGVPASFSISNRLYFLVAETDMTDIWEVQPHRRYRAYLAGMLSDLLIMSICIILMYLNDLTVISISLLFYKVLKWLVLVQILSLAWQFLFFMETDIYYVIGNYFRTSDLMTDTKTYVTNLWRRICRKKPHPLQRDPKEMKVIKIYSGFWAAATFITLFRFFVFQLPITIMFFGKAVSKLGSTGGNLIDGIIFLCFFLFDYGLLIYALHKKHKQHGKRLHIGHILHHLFHKHSRHKHR